MPFTYLLATLLFSSCNLVANGSETFKFTVPCQNGNENNYYEKIYFSLLITLIEINKLFWKRISLWTKIIFAFNFFKGLLLCMNSPVDPNLLQLVQQEVLSVKDAVKNMSEGEEEKNKILDELQRCWSALVERVEVMENNLADVTERVGCVESRVDRLENRVCGTEESFESLVVTDLQCKC